MAPEKTDVESGDETPNTSSLSLDHNTSAVSESEHEPYFEPVVHLPEVEVKTFEEDEKELLKLRCKLFRYHNLEIPAEWKERGTGDVKILHHTDKKTVRVIMRQDKTLKVRANHYITPYMELLPNCDSDRAYVWSSKADFADEESKQETFAIKFANAEHAKLFKEKFIEAKNIATVEEKRDSKEEKPLPSNTDSKNIETSGNLESKLEKLSFSDKKDEKCDAQSSQ